MSNRDVRNLIDEIAQLSHTELPPTEFYGEILGKVAPRLQASATAVWNCHEGHLDLLCQDGLDGKLLIDHDIRSGHESLLSDIHTSGQPRLVYPGKQGVSPEAVNRTDFVLGLCPVKVGERVVSIIETFQTANGHPAQAEAGLKLLTVVAGLATNYHRNQELRWWHDIDTFSETIHTSLDPNQTAYTIVNEGRRVIGCDRLTVLSQKGRKCRVLAISGQESVHRRANSVRLMQRLVARVLAIGEPLIYPNRREELPPQLDRALQDYIDESQTRLLYVVPLVKTRPEPVDDRVDHSPPQTIGAVVAEEFAGESFQTPRVDAVARHASRAMDNSLEHGQIFLLPVWKALGKIGWIFRVQTLPKTIGIVLLLVALIIAGLYIPGDFKLTADGTLQPEDRHHIFAEVEGVVDAKLPIKHGSSVRVGTTLVELRSIEIEKQVERVEGEIRTTQETLKTNRESLLYQERQTNADPAIVIDLSAQLTVAMERLKGLQIQRDLLAQQEAKLTVKSPANGEVLSWNIEDLLKNRPVKRGDLLLTVADWDGPWVLELLLPDNRVGHLIDAQGELREDLRVTYMVATDPDTSLEGTIKKVASSTRLDEKEGLGVLVTVEIDKSDVHHLRPGAKVTGRIHCGKRSIAYVWLHGVVEWFQTEVLFRFF